MRALLLVGLGGSVGAIGRYVLGEFVKQRFPDHPHAGTFTVNMLGCLLIGLVMNLVIAGESLSDSWRLVLVTGCLGALTTFSTFGYETVLLVQQQRTGDAVMNVLANVAVGLPAVLLGMRLASLLR